MYCTADELTQYVLSKYLDKIEQLRPGIVQGHIDGVSSEIDDALRPRFSLPLVNPPETIRRIARVVAAYRCVGAITSLMDTEAASANVWIPLQKQHDLALKQLEKVANGELDLGLEALGNEPDDTTDAVMVHKKPGKFNNDAFWDRY